MYRSRRGRKASIYRSNYTLIRRRSPRSNSPYTISRKRVRKILSHILPDSNALAVMSSTTMHWGSDITRSLKRGVKIPADTRRGMKRRRMSLHMGNLMAGPAANTKSTSVSSPVRWRVSETISTCRTPGARSHLASSVKTMSNRSASVRGCAASGAHLSVPRGASAWLSVTTRTRSSNAALHASSLNRPSASMPIASTFEWDRDNRDAYGKCSVCTYRDFAVALRVRTRSPIVTMQGNT